LKGLRASREGGEEKRGEKSFPFAAFAIFARKKPLPFLNRLCPHPAFVYQQTSLAYQQRASVALQTSLACQQTSLAYQQMSFVVLQTRLAYQQTSLAYQQTSFAYQQTWLAYQQTWLAYQQTSFAY
jgi:hypothetical protein